MFREASRRDRERTVCSGALEASLRLSLSLSHLLHVQPLFLQAKSRCLSSLRRGHPAPSFPLRLPLTAIRELPGVSRIHRKCNHADMNRRGKSVQWVIFMHCSRKRGFDELAGLAARRNARVIAYPGLIGLRAVFGGFFLPVETLFVVR